jgi:hypothetical protein
VGRSTIKIIFRDSPAKKRFLKHKNSSKRQFLAHEREFSDILQQEKHFVIPHLLLAAKTALTAQTGSLVSPTKNVTSHSSGIDARNFMSSARPDLFSNVLRSGSSLSASAIVKL